MRVALVTGGLPLGGSTTFTLYLARGLQSVGVNAQVFSFSSDHPLAPEFSAAGIKTHTRNEHLEIYEDRLESLYRLIRAFDPSVAMAVLGVESFEMLRYLPAGVLRLGVIHDMAIQPHTFIPPYRQTLDHLVVVARYLIPEVARIENCPPVRYLPLGIPITNLVAPRNPNPDRPLRLLYYGRLENESKGVRLFPKIADALKRRGLRYYWTIQGKGPEEDFLRKALASEIREGVVSLTPPVELARLASVVRNHDIYLLSSTNEGGPLTLLESMALGLVPVCGDIPGLVTEVIDANNGFRVPQAEADAYAQSIGALDADRALLERMSVAACKKITGNFSQEAMGERFAEFFRSCADRASPRIWPDAISPRGLTGIALLTSSPLGRSLRRLHKRLRVRSA